MPALQLQQLIRVQEGMGSSAVPAWTKMSSAAFSWLSRQLQLEFSPDGKSLATTSNDGTARLWDAATGEGLFTLTGHTQAAFDVVFSPDGRLLATSGWDGTVRIYVLPVEELLEIAKARVTRSLTDDECRQFLHLEQCP